MRPTPLILFGLIPLANWSFEDDPDTTDPPTSWEDVSVNAINEVTASHSHSAGDGIPSAQSLRQNVVDGSAGNVARIRQRIDVSQVPAFLRGTGVGSPEFAVASMFRPGNEAAATNARLEVHQFYGAGATSAPGTGTELTGAITRRMEYGKAEWRLRLCAVRLDPQTTHLDIHLAYDPAGAGYAAAADAWWDRLLAGNLLDLQRGFSRFEVRPEPGYRVNEGNGQHEIVPYRRPRTRISATIEKVIEGGPDDAGLKRFLRWLETTPGDIALWQNRNLHTNAERHFQSIYVDPRLRVQYPKGLTRRGYPLRLVASSEGHG